MVDEQVVPTTTAFVRSWATETAVSNGHSGVEAAETGESDAQGGDSKCRANDGTVGVAHYVRATLQGIKGKSQIMSANATIEEAIIPAIGYRLPGLDDGGIGPRQEALRVLTGWSLSGHQTVNSPLVSRT